MSYRRIPVGCDLNADQIEEHESPNIINPINKSQIVQEKLNPQQNVGDLSDSKINESNSDHNNAATEMKKVNNIEKAKTALMAPLMRKKPHGHSRSSSHDYSQPAGSNEEDLSKPVSQNNIQVTIDEENQKTKEAKITPDFNK